MDSNLLYELLSPEVLSLPTRDGNRLVKALLFQACFVLSLPTRDGNALTVNLSPRTGISFKPTYKEWKFQGVKLTLKEMQASFKPTYKGWKFLYLYLYSSSKPSF